MITRRSHAESFSPMAVAAGISVVVLVGVLLWQATQSFGKDGGTLSASNGASALPLRASTPFDSIDWQSGSLSGDSAPTDKDGLSNISTNVLGTIVGSYASLNEDGVYTPSEGEKVAGDIAASLHANVSYKTYEASDVTTTSDTSYDRMLVYRGDMQVALGPLLKNTEYELNIFAGYIDTGDEKKLTQLKSAAQNYRDAIANAAKVVVPSDATSYHVGILNALSEFASTIDAMAISADDPFAGAALLRTYNAAEQNVLVSFNALAQFSKNKSS